ncbi:hypothetical protein DU478_15385 [Thalassococcus profundi]|uniref:DUF4145 domain-containing protein n=1 Tax=Thalassococcus profundi TaxID=2282382 RepID=A0A369TJ40_9RHOB|nr:hypothetical protein [Thalassococcus profundi]RDD65288.1 hypothetical protein DU478_15385 [Thalassococcus profundi]
MNWLEWSSAVIGSTAWPIAISVVALIYRGQIGRLLKRIKGAKYGNAEVYFGAELDKIEAQASGFLTRSEADVGETSIEASQSATRTNTDCERASDDGPETIQISERQDRFTEIAKLSPSAAVLDAWRDVELELKRSFERSGLPREKGMIAPLQVGMKLYKMGVIHAHTMEMISHLQSLRNAAAHTEEVSVTDAYRFKTLANNAIDRLQYDLAR